MAWPLTRYKDAAAGGSWTPDDMNGVQDQLINARGFAADGVCVNTAQESTSSDTYTALTTPDIVSGIVLPTNGLIVVVFGALWRSNVSGAGRAAIFLNEDQVKGYLSSSTPPGGSEAVTNSANVFSPLISFGEGIYTEGTADTTSPSSGVSPMALTPGQFGGPCHIWADAGTYDVSIRYHRTSGSGATVDVADRRLYVYTITPPS